MPVRYQLNSCIDNLKVIICVYLHIRHLMCWNSFQIDSVFFVNKYIERAFCSTNFTEKSLPNSRYTADGKVRIILLDFVALASAHVRLLIDKYLDMNR